MNMKMKREYECNLCECTRLVGENELPEGWWVVKRTREGIVYVIHLCEACAGIVRRQCLGSEPVEPVEPVEEDESPLTFDSLPRHQREEAIRDLEAEQGG